MICWFDPADTAVSLSLSLCSDSEDEGHASAFAPVDVGVRARMVCAPVLRLLLNATTFTSPCVCVQIAFKWLGAIRPDAAPLLAQAGGTEGAVHVPLNVPSLSGAPAASRNSVYMTSLQISSSSEEDEDEEDEGELSQGESEGKGREGESEESDSEAEALHGRAAGSAAGVQTEVKYLLR